MFYAIKELRIRRPEEPVSQVYPKILFHTFAKNLEEKKVKWPKSTTDIVHMEGSSL